MSESNDRPAGISGRTAPVLPSLTLTPCLVPRVSFPASHPLFSRHVRFLFQLNAREPLPPSLFSLLSPTFKITNRPIDGRATRRGGPTRNIRPVVADKRCIDKASRRAAFSRMVPLLDNVSHSSLIPAAPSVPLVSAITEG